ncbi:hypothetical protein M404DRAFT_18440 [Pisolithus tinctorius Marx 270]|uniref:Uncharacterized protein n=1 Tax=Pisolithus tinctorius Marx 270 TaxID=870435 RepID=A0A0C3PYG1_PISTI|nr:hypothetical protein M404DRAFT_18440 [Pisolithus tinctorius Marx 270]
MAGAFSGHLLDSFNAKQPMHSAPNVVTSGAMSFSPQAHGFFPFPLTSLFGNTPFTDPPEETATKIATLQAKLNKKLGPEFVSQRPGPGGGPKLTYAEGWKIINLANEVFGFNGWSSSVVNITTDFIDYNEETRRFNVGVTAILRVTLKDGVYHEDVGYGMLENSKSKAAALDKVILSLAISSAAVDCRHGQCKKEAITDALKRTLRNFGNLLGNCLYDKAYAQEVVKMKVPPAKFDKSDLYRRPEFEDTKPSAPQSNPPEVPGRPVQTANTSTVALQQARPMVKTEAVSEQLEKPMAYVPRHMRQEMAPVAQQNTNSKETAQGTSNQPVKEVVNTRPNAQQTTGLQTPVQTPSGQTPVQQPRGQCDRQPSDRRLSFADTLDDNDEPPVTLPSTQNNYGLNSDDEAFFASVDLGDCDLGRPIDFEEGMGGVSTTDDYMLDQEQAFRPAAARSPVIRHAQAHACNVAGPSGSSDTIPQNRRATIVPGGVVAGRSSVSGSSSASAPSPKVDAASPSTGSTTSSRQKPLILPQGQQQTNPQGGPPAIGVKRNVDSMQGSSSTTFRAPLQGMGLSRQWKQYSRAIAERQPMVSPDPDTNGDFKRVKR